MSVTLAERKKDAFNSYAWDIYCGTVLGRKVPMPSDEAMDKIFAALPHTCDCEYCGYEENKRETNE